METSPSLTAIASSLSITPSSRLNRVSCAPCFRRRRRRPPRCSRKQQAATQREAKNEEAEKGRRIQGWFGSLDRIGVDILSIAVPAALALAADPIAALVDTAFVGHLGSAELAAVGVSISVFNLVSKLFNVPLLNVTTSFVAEQQATDDDYTGNRESKLVESLKIFVKHQLPCLNYYDWLFSSHLGSELPRSPEKLTEERKLLPAVSTSLALAAGIGLVETVALILGSGTLMNTIGVPTDSPMRIPAEQFLTFRAYGAPPVVVALAAQGAFRGLMDTRTPLYAVGIGNLVNVILDAILVFPLGLGVRGAALATVTSEYVIACILLWKLNSKVVLFSNVIGGGIIRYLKSGGLLIGRTIAVLLTMTLSTSLAAREGPVPMAGHQLCLQVWLTISLLNDALALAGQALLASEYAKRNYKQARVVLYRVLQANTSPSDGEATPGGQEGSVDDSPPAVRPRQQPVRPPDAVRPQIRPVRPPMMNRNQKHSCDVRETSSGVLSRYFKQEKAVFDNRLIKESPRRPPNRKRSRSPRRRTVASPKVEDTKCAEYTYSPVRHYFSANKCYCLCCRWALLWRIRLCVCCILYVLCWGCFISVPSYCHSNVWP